MAAALRDDLAPPVTSIGVIGWLRKNLFSNWFNSLLSLISLWVLVTLGGEFVRWALTGARWSVVSSNLRLFMVGPYPPDQVWRVWLVLGTVSLLFGLAAGAIGGTIRQFAAALAFTLCGLALLPFELVGRGWLLGNAAVLGIGYMVARGRTRMRPWLVILALASFAVSMLLLQGFEGSAVLPQVSTSQWGGLLLTFVLTVVSIVVSFPLGVLLALGRRSQLVTVRWFSILYIEIVRGVPLITILYMTQIMLPLFLPAEMRIDSVIRAMAGMILFTAAYTAENVRGGLQAVPSGQAEAANALGLNNALTTLFIVLPQALRMVIPASVGQFISLFKDTTLVLIVGLLDLLSVGRSVLAQPESMGTQTEVYLFIAAVFFVFSYAMSYASYQLESALGVGKR